MPLTGSITSPQIIEADYTKIRGSLSQTFRECVGAGRAGEGLRAEWRTQLKECKDAIGFKYLRFHGLLHDELGVYSEDAKGNPQYNWQYIDDLYDYLLSIGVRPFVEFGFTPNALATIPVGDQQWATNQDNQRRVSVFWWKGNITPPKAYAKWDNLIQALTQHWTERYGADEVTQWYFEVWNEPDHRSFFSPNNTNNRCAEYLELYDHTARAVKAVNPAYRVGGPSGATTNFILPLINFCATNHTPLDFISFHAYGAHAFMKDGQIVLLDEFGNKQLALDENLRRPADIALGQLPAIASSALPKLPIFMTEWSSSASPRDPMHDAYVVPSYILENLKTSERGLGCFSYWVFTDIFEESGIPKTPFHGGFGLINMQGIKKSAFFAFQFMGQLGDTELINTDKHSWACRDASGGVQVLLWDATHPTGGKVANQIFFREIHPPAATPGAEIKLHGIPPGDYRLEISRVGFKHNDPYTTYLEMGLPQNLSLDQIKQLKSLATGAPDETLTITIPASGEFTRHLPMLADDVVLLKLIPQPTTPTKTP
jgi:xylan 1,4-beta-xylosidase